MSTLVRQLLQKNHTLKVFTGDKYRELANNWKSTAAVWGGLGAVVVVWASDWKAVWQYVPYIRGKFIQKDE
ncbi:cytochrome b-c1 complex subunit 10-like [Branchiostoma floridae x Branchiostoma japonicum]